MSTLHADVLKLLDELAAARAVGNSLVDHHTAITPALDALMAQRDDIHAEVHGAPAAKPAADHAPVAATSRHGPAMRA